MVATPASLRRTNQRAIIALLGRLNVASRAELAKAAGMSQPTAGKIVDDLLRNGILEEVGTDSPARDSTSPRLGRPGRLLRLDSRRPRFIAIQFGVVHTRLAMLPVAAPAEDHWTISFRTPATAAQWLAGLHKSAATLAGGTKHNSRPWGVMMSIPGIIDESSGKVLLGPNLHWMESVHLGQLLRQVWSDPVCLIQEIRALALGHLTIDKPGEDFLLVDFDQGVGGAAVIGGKLFAGSSSLSGELGHTPVPGNERNCGCGAVGCVETLVSRRGLLQSFAAHGGSPRWSDFVHSVGCKGISGWLARSLDAAAASIAGATNVLGLRRVVITGSLTELGQSVMDYLAAAVRRGSLWARFGEVICHGAPRRWSAGLISAGIDRLLVPVDHP